MIGSLASGRIIQQSFRQLIYATALALLAWTMLGFSSGLTGLSATAEAGPIRIARGETSRQLSISLDKSVVLRLPVAARDVLVGNPAVVDAVARTPYTVYLFAKKLGETNIFFFDEQGRQVLSLDIAVGRDSGALKNVIDKVIPGNKIKVDSLGQSIVLSGSVRSAGQSNEALRLAQQYVDDKEKVVNSISVIDKQQVMLRVRVMEVQRNILKQVGVDTNNMLRLGSATVSLVTSNPFTLNSVLPGVAAGLSGSSGSVTFSDTIRLAERNGLVRTLAEPTLTTISGEAAKFLAGGEFPVPVEGDNNSISVEFKPFGVGLGFTPIVLGEDRISLKISTEVSELSNNGAVTISTLTIPALQVRRAETTVELPSGGSMVLAGLIQEKLQQDINGIPGLKEVPILGTLFKSRDFNRNETELVITVTPLIVKPVSEKQIASPLDGLKDSHDLDSIFFGRLHQVYGVSSDELPGTYHGQVGYIIE
ncbi:MAG: type II and III secretion system protein family protein [Alphaproteobacteria bacterium]|nr:type II and III secretion system protein family protein [Alphaproteobacteria bacterium]